MLDLFSLAQQLKRYPLPREGPSGFSVGPHHLDFTRERYLTGVINLSSDSWYKESICLDPESAVLRGRQLMAEGATIIDLGAESTLPDAQRVGVKAQLEKLLPVVSTLSKAGAIVSVESYYPEVLEKCAQAGARVFNLTGMAEVADVFQLAAKYDAAVILCYVAGDNPRKVQDLVGVEDIFPVQIEYFKNLIVKAGACGLNKLFLDPGLGFYYRNLVDSALRVKYQIETLLQSYRLHELGYPVFNIVPHAPDYFGDDERRSAEPFFSVLALLGGTHVIRTHEVKTLSRIVKLMGDYAA